MSSSESTEAAGPNEQRGYCHVCDSQVQIEPVSFTCSVCNGGFIELLDTTETTQQGQHTMNSENFSRFMNDGNNPISQLLPLLLGSLGQAGAQNVPINININQSRGSPNSRLQFIVPPVTNEPGAQVDLYGCQVPIYTRIINNVLSDVLTGRPAGMASAPHIQFIQQPPIRMFQLHGDMRDYAWGAGGLDTIITQLLNQLENTGPPPATEHQLEQLPTVKINEVEFEKKIECAICMEDFRLNEEAKRLPCKHCFHEQCIKDWLKLHGTCPVCRKNLNGEDTSQREYITPAEQNAQAAAEEAASAQSESEAAGNGAGGGGGSGDRQSGERSNSDGSRQVYDSDDFD